MSYFNKFPKTRFNKQSVVDISRRVKIVSRIRESVYDYARYTVKDGERPEDIAFYYYDDPTYAWLVLLANDIVDPYSQWVKEDNELNEYIMVKYENASGLTGREVLEWTKNTQISENIVFYRSAINPNIKLNSTTFDEFPNNEFRPVRIYDYEFELNEGKREILLVDKRYLTEINALIGDALSD